MKRFGILLMGAIFFTGIYAGAIAQTTNDSTGAIAVSTDSIEYLFQKENLSVREAALLQKLSPEQLMQLEQQRLDNERRKEKDKIPLPSWSIVLIATSPFLMVVLIVFFSVRARKERERIRYDLYMKSLEAGQPLPEKFFEAAEKKSSNLKKGAIWLAVGLGVIIFGILDGDTDLMGLGAIPALVGAAFLLVHFIEEKNNNNTDTPAINE